MIVGIETLSKAKNSTHKFRTLTGVHPGDRIAQLVLERILTPAISEVPALEGTSQTPVRSSPSVDPSSAGPGLSNEACLVPLLYQDFVSTTPGPSSTPSLARDVIADASGSFEAQDAGLDESSPSSRVLEGPSVRFS